MDDPQPVRGLEQAIRLHETLWAAGDYSVVAEQFSDVNAAVVAAARVEPGCGYLTCGPGSGNTAILAARAGAAVTAADLTDDLFDVCRRRAGQAGVDVEWITTNPECLPFSHAPFDRVLGDWRIARDGA